MNYSELMFVVLLFGGTYIFYQCLKLLVLAWQSHVDNWSNYAIGGLSLSRPRLVQRTLVTRLRRLVGAFRKRQRRVVGQKFQQAHYAKHHPRISAWKELVK